MASDVDLGRRIRDARIARGMSQADLARRLDVSATAVWNWEMNGARPRPTMLTAIAGALEVTENYLRTGQVEDTASRTAVEIIYAARKEIADLNGVEIDRVRIAWRVGS